MSALGRCVATAVHVWAGGVGGVVHVHRENKTAATSPRPNARREAIAREVANPRPAHGAAENGRFPRAILTSEGRPAMTPLSGARRGRHTVRAEPCRVRLLELFERFALRVRRDDFVT